MSDFVQIRKAADFLGVSVGILREWERLGKIHPDRNPTNGYRLYLKAHLQAFSDSRDTTPYQKRPKRIKEQ